MTSSQLNITSVEQLQQMCAEGEQIIRSIRTVRAEGQRTVVTVCTFDGRSGELHIATKQVDAGMPTITTGDLTEQEWTFAACLNANRNRTLGVTPATRWDEWTADRFPNFEQTAAQRPIVTTSSDFRRPTQPGQPIILRDEHAPLGAQRHVYLVARIRFEPRDEVNERDDSRWTLECVEPTAQEREAEFVQRDIDRAAQADAYEKVQFETMMRNTNGYGL